MNRSRQETLPAPIRRILLVDEIVRAEPVAFRSESTPGHLVHVVQSGEVRQQAEGRLEVFGGGQVVWYHESEPVEGRITRAPWRFITINFDAPTLAPPPDHRRVMSVGPRTLLLARRLLAAWRESDGPAARRALRCTALLSELLLDFLPFGEIPPPGPVYPANAREKWWKAERQLRMRLDQPADLRSIARMAGMSLRTTIRACQAATGTTPVRRLRDLRLAHALGLLQHSDQSVTEIALSVGYARIQEFSRDFKKHYGRTPREARHQPPDYRKIRRG